MSFKLENILFNNPVRVLNSDRVSCLLNENGKLISFIFFIIFLNPSFSQNKKIDIKQEIIGKWKYIDSKFERIWTFEKKGKAIFEGTGNYNPGYSKLNYTYKFRSKSKIFLNPGYRPESVVSKIRINGDTLYLNTFKYIRQR